VQLFNARVAERYPGVEQLHRSGARSAAQRALEVLDVPDAARRTQPGSHLQRLLAYGAGLFYIILIRQRGGEQREVERLAAHEPPVHVQRTAGVPLGVGGFT